MHHNNTLAKYNTCTKSSNNFTIYLRSKGFNLIDIDDKTYNYTSKSKSILAGGLSLVYFLALLEGQKENHDKFKILSMTLLNTEIGYCTYVMMLSLILGAITKLLIWIK